MTQIIGRNRNTNDTDAISDAITLNSLVSVKIAGANPNRTFIRIDSALSVRACWIKLQAASVDNDKKGILLNSQNPNSNQQIAWEMAFDNIYTGEICAIAESGAPSVHVTEY